MIRIITGITEVLKRELRIIFQDRSIKSMILLAPLFYSLFYASIYFNKTERDVPVVVINMDKSTMSEKLIKNIDANENIKVMAEVDGYSTAKDLIYKEKAQAVIIIPKDFESSLKTYRSTTVKLLLNTTRFLVSNDINKAVNEVVLDFNNELKVKALEQKGISFNQSVIISEPLKEEVKLLFNPSETYGDFLIPAVLILILQQTLLMGLAESVSKERERNTFNDLIKRGNNSLTASIFGKGLFYLILFTSYAFMFYTIHFSVFSINQKGSWPLVLFITLIFVISVIFIGMFAASFIKSKMLSLQIMALSSYLIFFLSGYSWPQLGMPGLFQIISQFIPFTPFISAFVRITQMGAGLSDVMPQVVQLFILAIAGFIALYFRFKSMHRVSRLGIPK
jgi:ABC-2 type transport system permease protein